VPTLNHTHTLIRMRTRAPAPGFASILLRQWWRCNDPKCSYRDIGEMILGKATLCNQCGTEFILSREDLRRVEPRCLNCAETKEAKKHQIAKAIAGDIFKEKDKITKEDDEFLI
jgi:hypothetical protein